MLGDLGRVGELTAAGLVMVPAMWVLAASALLLHGVQPRWSLASWAMVAWAFVAAMFGGLLELPQWALNLSPFQHVPALPAASMQWLPLVLLVVVAAVFVAIGLAALDRRDVS